MHLAQLHTKPTGPSSHHMHNSSPTLPTGSQEGKQQSFGAVVSTMRNALALRPTIIIFIVGVILGFLIGTDLASSSSSSSSAAAAKQQQQKCPPCPSSSSSQLAAASAALDIDKQKEIDSYFPQFHPVAHKFEKVSKSWLQEMWAAVEQRMVRKDFAEPAQNSEQSAARLLTWTWIDVRPHINVLAVFTREELLHYLSDLIQSKPKLQQPEEQQKMLSHSASAVLSQDAKGAAHNAGTGPHYFFPVFIQTKYGYRGQSIAVVGGLFEPATDENLQQTAIRELREELGVVCGEVSAHGRWVNDGNRGCGTFQSHMARECKPAPKSDSDRAAADSEKQQLIFVSRSDLIQILANTREYAERSQNPAAKGRNEVVSDAFELPSLEERRKAAQNSVSTTTATTTGGDEQQQQQQQQNHPRGGVDVSNFVLKETKWVLTIAATLLRLEQISG